MPYYIDNTNDVSKYFEMKKEVIYLNNKMKYRLLRDRQFYTYRRHYNYLANILRSTSFTLGTYIIYSLKQT